MKLFAVYSNCHPVTNDTLVSVWTKLDVALEVAEYVKNDYVWVEEILVNSENLKEEDSEVYSVKWYDGTIAP